MKTKRTYTMGTRALQVEHTRHSILAGAVRLAGERPFVEVTLDAIASAAGVSVQTVLRQYGSRDGVIAAAMEHAMAEVEAERATPSGDVAGAVRTVVDHYERRGGASLLMLAQESYDDVAAAVTARGKALHRDWVRAAFSPATDDETVLDLLVLATDVYAWKLLRLDRGLSRATTERRLRALVDAVLASAQKDHD